MSGVKFYERVKMTVSGTPGTGAITLGSAVSTLYQSFAAAGVGNGETVDIYLTDGAANGRESASYNSSTGVLTRTFISSTTGSTLSLSSAATVEIVPAAADLNACIRADVVQALTTAQQSQATANIGLGLSFRNRLINGDHRFDQRNEGSGSTAINVYMTDRWTYLASQTGKLTWGQNLNAITPPVGFSSYLGFQSASAYSVGSSDYFVFGQLVEGLNFYDLGWGTANALAATLSFWVRSSLTGTFGGVVRNFASTRSYPFTYSIAAANTWTYISIAIPGDTSGTWVGASTAGALSILLGLGIGSGQVGSPGSWASAGAAGASGAVSLVGTNSATFYITGAQFEAASTPTTFERRPWLIEHLLCQRYYFKTWAPGTPVATAASQDSVLSFIGSGAGYWSLPYPTPMRVVPTTVIYDASGNPNAVDNASGTPTSYSSARGLMVGCTGTSGNYVHWHATANAEL